MGSILFLLLTRAEEEVVQVDQSRTRIMTVSSRRLTNKATANLELMLEPWWFHTHTRRPVAGHHIR
jgi:hypothetical protein